MLCRAVRRPRDFLRHPPSLALLSAGVFLWLCALGGPGRAQTPPPASGDDEPPVAVVIPFGSTVPRLAERWSAICEKALSHIAGLKVLGADKWRKEATDSGQGDDLEAMAKRLDADVLVTGTLSQEGTLWRVSVDLFEDKGMPVGAFTILMAAAEPGPAALFQLEDGLSRIIRPAVGLKDGPLEVASGEEPAPQDADRERPVDLNHVEGLRPPGKDAVKPPRPVRPPWRSLVEVNGGLTVIGRSFSCGDADPTRRNRPCTSPDYPLDAGAGLRLSASLFPLNLLGPQVHPALLGLGLTFVLDVPFWRDRVRADSAVFPVKELRFEGGLRWRYKLGDRAARATMPTRPVLEAGLVYGYHHFLLSDGTTQPPFPDLRYQYLLPSVGIGTYLLRSRLHVHGAVGVLGVLSAGPLFDPVTVSNQNPFGPGSAVGFRLSAEAEYRVYRGLWLSVGGSVDRISFFFNGAGCAKLNAGAVQCDGGGPPGTPIALPVSTAADLYLGLWATAGYRY